MDTRPIVSDPNNHAVDSPRYRDYLRLMERVVRKFGRYYLSTERELRTREEESMAIYALKFLQTIRALRLKYLYSPLYLAQPRIDLTDSGFPSAYDISLLDADLATKNERLPKFASLETLKQKLLDNLMTIPSDEDRDRHEEKRRDLQWQISERAYLESLDLRTQFFQFTPGKLLEIPAEDFAEEGRRAYIFSWGCYDRERNRPGVYFMILTQDLKERPLETGSPAYMMFLETIQGIACRTPDNLRAIAVRLDESFATLHPKMLKRIMVGPLVSPMLHRNVETYTPQPGSLEARLMPVIERAELKSNDFVLLFSTEFVYSEREEVPQHFLSLKRPKARQIFHVPKNDRDLLKRGASSVTRYALLPHALRQHLNDEDVKHVPELAGCEYLIYQTKGDVINVG
jgi:uncharacterized protein (DUF1330 family)